MMQPRQPRDKTHARLLKKLAAKTAEKKNIEVKEDTLTTSLKNSKQDCWTINSYDVPYDTEAEYDFKADRNNLINSIKNNANLTEVPSCTVSDSPVWVGETCYGFNMFRGMNNSLDSNNVTEPVLISSLNAFCDKSHSFFLGKQIAYGLLLAGMSVLLLTPFIGLYERCKKKKPATENSDEQPGSVERETTYEPPTVSQEGSLNALRTPLLNPQEEGIPQSGRLSP